MDANVWVNIKIAMPPDSTHIQGSDHVQGYDHIIANPWGGSTL